MLSSYVKNSGWLERLWANDETLTMLNLAGRDIDEQGFNSITDALKHNTALQALHLSVSAIGDGRARAISEALKQNVALQELDLYSNVIGVEGAQAIADALKQNKTLKILDLSRNFIRDEGAKAIADALKQNKSLQRLDLSYNCIRDTGAEAVADILLHDTLQVLNLRGNSIDERGWGCKPIADALTHNKVLQKLDLCYNDIGDEGCRAIADALMHNDTLKELYLGAPMFSYDFSVEDRKAITDAMRRNITITAYCPETRQTRRIIKRNKQLLLQLPQQAYDLAVALWSTIGGDVYTLLLVFEKFPHVSLVPLHRLVALLQQAIDQVVRKEAEAIEYCCSKRSIMEKRQKRQRTRKRKR